MKIFVAALFILMNFNNIMGQDYRPELLFREDFKEIPAEIPVSQKHINNPDISLQLYGPAADSLKKSHHDKPVDDPYYLWTGLCLDSWAVTFKHNDALANLGEYAKIRWRTKQAGFHQLHIILKLKNGQWLISEQYDGPTSDWRITEFNISDIQWWTFDIDRIKEVKPVDRDTLDLSEVDEIGCTDLMRGGGSNACSRLDWIEVYAKPQKR